MLLLGSWAEVLVVVRVEDVDDEVEVQVELELFGHKVSAQHLHWNKHLPSFEELLLLTTVERRAQRIQQRFRIIVQPGEQRCMVSASEEKNL